jgi:hypothetical protein
VVSMFGLNVFHFASRYVPRFAAGGAAVSLADRGMRRADRFVERSASAGIPVE